MLDGAQRASAAERLWAAERDRAPIEPLTEAYPDIDVVDAYEIQLVNIRRRLAAGARVHGHKVGLSSPVMQRMMGVDEPDYGHLLDTMVLAQDTPIKADRYCYPRVEVEIGYVLGASLPGEGCTEEDVLAATAYIVPSLELIDSRIADWRIRLADTIADNASSAGVILGEARKTPAELAAAGIDLAAIEAVLYATGPGGAEEEIARGDTGAVLGDPTTAVAWLARKVASFGVKLEAGHLILPGSCTRAVDARPGDAFRAEFAGLGSVTARFE
ncbi:2-keto-4-pentenoate hydratase [Thermocatellispora tengchongensis]|uniref:2-keto-4-pentenoate hydratase n=1 Tax=Thermocatellispora tengchongensis TaxID=1073253 RepID=A0A840PDR9_9ACTN|nr:2-keto-4-pentenoate hydratase [Thermocatellispora tengchongensis]MBB5136876.1 2-keto-4-pentenoate hydratase [Thermocatellispora tengchongensis]